MKNRLILSFAFLFFAFSLSAQDFEIVSVESLPADMSAREEMKTDHNDRQCALLRIATQNIAPEQRERFVITADLGSEVVERVTRDGEILLWVSPGLKYLIIKHGDLGKYELYLPKYVRSVEALHTYKVTIKGTLPVMPQEQKNDSPTQQYLVFQLSPTNAMLEVDGQLWEVAPDGTAMKFVNFGTYSYRVQAPNYLPQTGKVTVDDPVNTKIESVRLKSDLVQVTFQVDADAEIWINNEKKGIRTWSGSLGKGTYKIECKQANHETTTISQEVTASSDGKTITLPAPIPVYGSLSIESSPNFAKVYIDGNEIGETPKYINEILVGEHKVKVVKDGYANYSEPVFINKGERKIVSVTLNDSPKGARGQFSVNKSKKVCFSPGNLQYQATTNIWRFAENQWDYIGGANKKISKDYDGWIDLFGWGTSGWNNGNTNYQPWCSSTSDVTYGMPKKENSWELPSSYPSGVYDLSGSNANADWGVYNPISNGGNEVHQWRTLSSREWAFVFNIRSTASGIRYAKAQVNGTNGIILLPDDWSTQTFNLSNTNNRTANFSSNKLDSSQWMVLEQAGAVFLPAAGCRTGITVEHAGEIGYYWTTSCYDEGWAYHVIFHDSYIYPENYFCRSYGFSVRLVQDYQP